MKDKGKEVLICSTGGNVRHMYHLINAIKDTDHFVVVNEEKKEQKPFVREPIEFKVSNHIDIVPYAAKPLKTAKDWDRKNYQQRNKKHKSKRK